MNRGRKGDSSILKRNNNFILILLRSVGEVGSEGGEKFLGEGGGGVDEVVVRVDKFFGEGHYVCWKKKKKKKKKL